MDRETVLTHIRSETNGFIDHNGIRVVDVDEDKSVLAAEVTDFSRNVWGNVHGGFLYTMADTAAGVFLRAKYGYRNVTLSGSISYLHSTAGAQKITAICREIKGRPQHRIFRGGSGTGRKHPGRPGPIQHVSI